MNIEHINTKVYAGRVKDRDALMNSSSGGAFTALSDLFLNAGDAVIAASYNYQSYAEEFKLIFTKADRDAARGSKYMQSKPGNVFLEAEKWLKENPDKKLLFVGMGCQAYGFCKFSELRGIRDRVYIVDIICHGSPSPKLWREYAGVLEKRKHGKITYLTFKDKRYGWKAFTSIVLINGKEVSIRDYVRVFYNRCALRPSCHMCPFATMDRKTDITIGDFWHIEDTIPDFYNNAGTSLFLLHTNRGEELFESIKINLEYRLSDTKQCWQANLEAPTPVSKHRNEFWMDYHKKGIQYIINKCKIIYIQRKVKDKIQKVWRGR